MFSKEIKPMIKAASIAAWIIITAGLMVAIVVAPFIIYSLWGITWWLIGSSLLLIFFLSCAVAGW